MNYLKHIISIYYLLFLSTTHCNVQFSGSGDLCLDQPVEYSCSVTGSTLVWRVYRDNGTQFGANAAFLISANIAPVTLGGVFAVERISTSPLTSNISFTVESGIDGYNINCEDDTTKENRSIGIKVFEYSGNITIHTDTFTSTSVDISWTESPSYCGPVIYRYNISSKPELVESATNDNVMVGDLTPSDEPYCITVNVIYTYTTRTTSKQCFLFQVPNPVQNLTANNETELNTTNVVVEWEESVDFDVPHYVVTPPFMNYRVTLFNSTDDGTVSYDSGLLSPGTTTYTFTEVSPGRIYTVTVEAINRVGKNSNSTTIAIAGDIINVTPSSSSTTLNMMTMTSATNSGSSSVARSSFYMVLPSSSPSMPTESSPTNTSKESILEVPAIVGIVAGVIILILVVTVVILVIVYCCCCKQDHGSASDPIPMTEKHRARTHQPETGQPTYEDPNNAVQHKQAPTGDLYAQPDVKPGSSGRRPPPQPTYQDPNTIQRQQGPTGDMYAMPDRKPAYSDVKKPGPGELYADLDLSTNSPRSPQPLIPSEQQHQPVLYSDVQHLR